MSSSQSLLDEEVILQALLSHISGNKTLDLSGKILVVPLQYCGSLEDERFLLSHIFAPSPYFSDIWQSLNGKYSISIQPDQTSFLCNDSELVRIVSQESNPASSQPASPFLVKPSFTDTFRIFYIDRLFIIPSDFTNDNASSFPDAHLNLPAVVSSSIADQESYLRQFHIEIWLELVEKCDEFTGSFIIVGGFLDQASLRLQSIVDGLAAMNKWYPEIVNPLYLIIGNVGMARVSLYLFDKLFQIFSREDEKFHILLEAYHTTAQKSPSKLGLSPLLGDNLDISYFKKTCEMLKILFSSSEETRTPLALKSQISAIINDLSTSCQKMIQQTNNGKQLNLSADDLLPLLVVCLVHAKPTRVHSVMQYLKYFHTSVANEYPQLEYCYTTLQAAVEYIQSDPLHLITPPPPVLEPKESFKTTLSSPILPPQNRNNANDIPKINPKDNNVDEEEEDFLDTLRRMNDGTSSSQMKRHN